MNSNPFFRVPSGFLHLEIIVRIDDTAPLSDGLVTFVEIGTLSKTAVDGNSNISKTMTLMTQDKKHM